MHASDRIGSNILIPGTLKRKADASNAAPAVIQLSQVENPAYGVCLKPRNSHSTEDHWEAKLGLLGNSSPDTSSRPSSSSARSPVVNLFAVFDGHNGQHASKHAVQRLSGLLGAQLHEQLQRKADVDDCIETALEQAFLLTDAEMKHMPLMSSAGTTATVCCMTQKRIYLAWVGDSRAVVWANGKPLAYTDDHRAQREDEQERIAAAGGLVFNNSGLRVMGVLATTRAIGDHDLRPYGVVPTPDVLVLPRTDELEYMVLASDGLWDVMDEEHVYNMASRSMQKIHSDHPPGADHQGVCRACKAAGCAARVLARVAREKGSRDDITVMVVNLKTACECVRPGGQHHSCSSLAPKKAMQLACTSGTLGSRSADDLERCGSLGRHNKARHSKSDMQLQQHAAEQQGTTSQLQQQWQQQQQPCSSQLPTPFSSGLFVQPSVCPAAANLRQLTATVMVGGAGAAAAAAAAAPVSDLVRLSPFASLATATQAPELLDQQMLVSAQSVGMAGAPASAPASSVSGDGSSGSAAGDSVVDDAARQVGSAPADMCNMLLEDEELQRSLSLALGGSRSCGLLGTGSLGSAELLAVLT